MKFIWIFILSLSTNLAISQVIDGIDFSTKCHTHCSHNKHNERFQEDEVMQCYVISPMQRFKVHYDTTGYNAVNRTDKDKNGIPDYIDSVCAVFDYVYEVEVIQMENQYPRSNADNLYYDVFVEDLGATKSYGWTTPSKYSGNKAYSTITIDNDYSPNDKYLDDDGTYKKTYNTTGIDGLKVTAAHEFHHAIQFDIGTLPMANSIYEMTAVCLEMLVYPELYDYVNYVNGLLTNLNKLNFGNTEANNGYSFGIFFYMLTELYGKDIIKDYLKLSNEVNNCYKGLDSILVLNNSSLHKTWMEFIEWIYHSGKNAIEGKYFPMASRFKTPVPTNTFKNYGLDVNLLAPYQLTYSRHLNTSDNPFIQADTVDIIFTNAGTNEVISHDKSMIQCTALSSETEKEDSKKFFENFWLKIYSPSQNMDYYLITKAGGPVNKISHCYPMPYNQNINTYLCFPIEDDVIIGDKLKLTIYNTNQISVFSEMVETTIDNHNRVLKYTPVLLESGVYTFTIERGSTDLVGKIVIK